MANYTGPITHIASVKLSPSGVRRFNQVFDIVCSKCGRPSSAAAEATPTAPDFLFFQANGRVLSPLVFVSERRAPITAAGFSRMIERADQNGHLNECVPGI